MSAPTETRLWQVDHPYYCSESNFYSNDCHAEYGSWQEFHTEQGADDMDLNLVFRWDWKPNEYIETTDDEAAYHVKFDDNYRAYTLHLFFMNQRKGIFRVAEVSVCRADEPAVREWLTTRAEHLRMLWTPLLPPQRPDRPTEE